MKFYKNIESIDINNLVKRPELPQKELSDTIKDVYNQVISKGDEALYSFSELYDKVSLSSLKVSEEDVKKAYDTLDSELKNSILIAKGNIEKFHAAQVEKSIEVETMDGVFCYRKSVPIERVGLYIPGGSAPLFSTILMLSIPAKIAGCKEIILCTPPSDNQKVNSIILATAYICGITEIYQIGGSQAIAAMAVGTSSIKKVSKIFGPGNQYVTAAKEMAVKYGTAIDMPAGPSEVLVYADNTCVPKYVASDLLAQAEHGEDSQVVCVVSDEEIGNQVIQEVNQQQDLLPRKDIAKAALENSFIICMNDINQAFNFINLYAPEHLIIASDNCDALAENVVNAGSVFLGNYSPESIGDYASGTNHTLPTYGWAKSYSGVSVDSFVRKITMQKITQEGIKNIGNTVVTMAEAEQLQAHANAVKIRLADLKTN